MTKAPEPSTGLSPVARWLLLTAGLVSLGLGVVGVVLPVLPTTPFILLSAACFARSSRRFHTWLLSNKTFGPMIERWQAERCISLRAKIISIAMLLATFSLTLIFVVQSNVARIGLASIGSAVVVLLLCLRTCPR